MFTAGFLITTIWGTSGRTVVEEEPNCVWNWTQVASWENERKKSNAIFLSTVTNSKQGIYILLSKVYLLLSKVYLLLSKVYILLSKVYLLLSKVYF